MGKEVLHTNESFDVVKKDDQFGIEPNQMNVVIMPYTSVRGLPTSIGVVNEINPYREGGKSITLITGTSVDEDPDILTTAQRRLSDVSGFDVVDPDRWSFLGLLTTSKQNSTSYPCFACDITGLEKAVGHNVESEFDMIAVNDALDTEDCFIPSLFMKVFRYIFNFKSLDDKNVKTTAKQGLADDIKDAVLAIDGINGIGPDVDGKVIILVKSDLNKESSAALSKVFKDTDREFVIQKM